MRERMYPNDHSSIDTADIGDSNRNDPEDDFHTANGDCRERNWNHAWPKWLSDILSHCKKQRNVWIG
jgi:hypothetical protein